MREKKRDEINKGSAVHQEENVPNMKKRTLKEKVSGEPPKGQEQEQKRDKLKGQTAHYKKGDLRGLLLAKKMMNS